MEPVQQRINSALAGQQAINGGEVAHELKADSGPELKQREDVRPEHTPPQL
jgi:hypothetical protein